jgi:hypothetical protein
MTNMPPRDRAGLIMAEHAAGKSIREIAGAYGHSTQTARDYVPGRRAPGEPAARDDDFARFAAYCRHRLADDPHLRTPALLAGLSALGFDGSRTTFYRALEPHGIQAHPCPDCHPASMSGYSPPAAARSPLPSPLPAPAAPVAGETLVCFPGRLAVADRTSPGAPPDILPPWFRVTTRWHDDRWQPSQLIPSADDAAARPALISGSTAEAPKAALPASGGERGRPLRAAVACRLCTTARGILQPVPVHLPACQQICIRHGIWLSGPGTPQFSVSGCPGIPDAERRARRLLRHCAAEQLIYSRIQAPDADDQAWKRRMMALIRSNPRSAAESSSQELFLAAACPGPVTVACTSRKNPA